MVGGQCDVRNQQVIDAESRVHIEEFVQAPDQKTGSYHHHQSERDFSGDEHVAQTPGVRPRGPASGSQRLVEIRRRVAERRDQAEQQSGQQCDAGGEQQDAAVDSDDVLQSRDALSAQNANQWHGAEGQQQAERAHPPRKVSGTR